MTKDDVKQALDRVLTWPADRQAEVIDFIEALDTQDGEGAYTLSDEDAAEVQRRLNENDPETMTFEEWSEHLRGWRERLQRMSE